MKQIFKLIVMFNNCLFRYIDDCRCEEVTDNCVSMRHDKSVIQKH